MIGQSKAHPTRLHARTQPYGALSHPGGLFPLFIFLFIALLVGVPLVTAAFISLRTGLPGQEGPLTLANFETVFLDPSGREVFVNTLIFASGTMVVTLGFTIPLVWLANKTDLPFKGLVYLLMAISVLIPTFLRAIAWILLTSPRIGIANLVAGSLFGVEGVGLSLYNFPGMWFVQGISFVPACFFMLSAAYRAMDPALEEAAQTCGVGRLMTFVRIILPLTFPAILAVTIYYSITAMSVFEAPAILGLPSGIFVLSSAIYQAVEPRDGLPNYGLAGAFGTIIVIIGFVASLFYVRIIRQTQKYAVVTGRGYKPKLVPLGKWKPLAIVFVLLYFSVELFLPFLMFLWASLLPYLRVPSWDALDSLTLIHYKNIFAYGTAPFINTLLLMLVAPLAAVALSIPISWIVVKTRLPYRGALDTLVFLSQAVPNIVLAVVLLYIFLISHNFISLYGTLWAIIIANVINSLAYSTRTINSSMIQIHRELEEAARASGVSNFITILKITLPLTAGAIFNAWLWVLLLSYREVTMALVLSSPRSQVLSTVIWSLWQEGQASQVAALGVVMMTTFFVIVFLLRGAFAKFHEARAT